MSYNGRKRGEGMTDAKWLEKLYGQHYDLLYNLGRRLALRYGLAEDSLYDQLQEVFMTLWRKREVLKNHPNPGGWLVNALKLQMAAQARKQRQGAMPLSPEAADAEPNRETPGPVELFLQAETIQAVEKLLGRETAALFLSYILHGATGKELAQALHVSEAAVRVRVSRAKKKLMKHPEIFLLLLSSMLGLRIS